MPRINSGSAQDTTIVGAGSAGYYVSQVAQNKSVITALFAEETAKEEQEQLFHLLVVKFPDNTVQHWADSNYTIKFGGTDYYPFPFKYNGTDINSDGTLEKASIVLANVDRSIMRYVETWQGLRNCPIKIKAVYKNALDGWYSGESYIDNSSTGNPAAYVEDEYLIDTYTATEQAVTFQLDPIIDMMIMLPRRRYMVDTCYWEFKDQSTCKYPTNGALTSCDMTFAACRAHDNEENFGGFPGISGSRRLYL